MPRLRSIKQNFLKTVDDSLVMVRNMNDGVNKGNIKIGQEHIYYFYEISFLKTYTAWERFLEETFIAYLIGHYTNKFKPKKIIKKIPESTAYNIIKGLRNYPDWTNIAKVIELAELYFYQGRPFSLPLERIRSHFMEMTIIRNAIVHVSKNSKDKYKGLLKSKSIPYNPNIPPGEFLSYKNKKTNNSYISDYSQYLTVSANDLILT